MTKELSRLTAYAYTQASPQTAPIVRIRFVTNHNSVRFARKKAQTVSFAECGFERLGLSHQTVGFRGFHVWLSRLRPWSLSPGGGLRGSGFWPFFPAPSMDYLLFLLY